jgi:hypothetical protein
VSGEDFGQVPNHRTQHCGNVRPHRVDVVDLNHADAMNFVGHIAVGLRARGRNATTAFAVGTALPDFASMARMRLQTGQGVLAEGIAVHHATDEAFHSNDWFVDLERSLRASLGRDGLPDGASRGCAHVGPELLLDGALFDDLRIADAVVLVYSALANPTVEVVDLVAEPERRRWRSHLMGVTTRLDPGGYRDADVVARRLHTVMARRPRLRFEDDLVPVLAARLHEVQPQVAASAEAVLDTISSTVARRTRK